MGKQWLKALLIGALFASGCSDENTAQDRISGKQGEKRGTPVIVQTVELEPEQVRLEAVGTSRARRSVTLHTKVSGKVTALHFNAGQRVEQGQVLLELDARDEKLAVDLARVRLADAERLYRRYQSSAKSITPSDLDSARSAVEAARIELDRARVALEDRTLEAPFAGHVGLTDIEVGSRIDPQTTVTTLDDRSSLLVSFKVPETLIDKLDLGDTLSITTWKTTDITASGRLIEVDSRIDPLNRTFIARAEVSNPDDRLRPGMSFRVKLTLDGKVYPVIPEVALQWGGEGSYVWRVSEGKAQRVLVTIAQRRKGRILVDAPLEQGDLVVREGVQRMRQGTAVSYTTVESDPMLDK